MKISENLEVTPLDKALPFGVVIRNLRIASMSEALCTELRDLWDQAGLILFKGPATSEDQVALSNVFGKAIAHPARETRTSIKGALDVIADPTDPCLVSVDGEMRSKPLPWHSDLIYSPIVNRGGLLRPVTLPSRWGETGFADQISAYDRLSASLKQRLEGLHVVYKYDLDMSKIRFAGNKNWDVKSYDKRMLAVQSRIDEFPEVIHPLVHTQPRTGRKVLYFSPWFAVRVHEMPGSDGDELLQEISNVLLQPESIYIHSWKQDEMVLWDNWRMLHCALGTPPDERRHMIRTTIAGDLGLGKSLQPDHAPTAEMI